MWIKRTLADELRKLTASFPVVALVGPRQVGKTSLLEHDFPEFRYVSLDTASQAEMADELRKLTASFPVVALVGPRQTRPAEFLQRFPPPVIIDEVQYAPALFRHIKAYVDAHRNERGLFLLTGSQNYALMQEISDSLAGRAAVIPFLGLSGAEWLASPAAKAWYLGTLLVARRLSRAVERRRRFARALVPGLPGDLPRTRCAQHPARRQPARFRALPARLRRALRPDPQHVRPRPRRRHLRHHGA
jgi:hypothetical protein